MAIQPPPNGAIPRHPVPGPHNRRTSPDAASLHCLLDQPGTLFTSSGRAAILLGLEALALAPTDRVLVPSYHCPTMVSPVVALGHRVGFYPIDADGRPSLEWLERNAPADARVLCVTHFFGLPLDLRDVHAWCQARGLLMLEDCAHAMFGDGPGGAVGTLGDVSIASLPKFFAVQEGGLLRVRRPLHPQRPLQAAGPRAELKARLDQLEISDRYGRLGRWRAWARPLLAVKQALRGSAPASAPPPAAATVFDPNAPYARIDVALSRQAPTQVTVRAVSDSDRARVIARRREHYLAMSKAFAGHAGAHPLFATLPDRAVPYVFPLWVASPDETYQALRQAGAPVLRWDWLWPGVPDMPGDHGKAWSRHVLQLLCHQDLSAEDLGWVIATVLANCAH